MFDCHLCMSFFVYTRNMTHNGMYTVKIELIFFVILYRVHTKLPSTAGNRVLRFVDQKYEFDI